MPRSHWQASVRAGFWKKIRKFAAQLPMAEDLLTAYYCAFDQRTPLAAWRLCFVVAGVRLFRRALSGARAADLDPAAVVFKLPDQIKWTENPAAGNANAVLYGDPSKPGVYVTRTKCEPACNFDPCRG